jgi:hypothetical protein
VNPRRPVLTALCSAVFLLASALALAAGRYDSKFRFHVIRTAHFTIYYHQGEAGLATRLAGIAESVREDLATRTGLVPPAHAHVVLVDQSDIANGWSTPVPYNLIEIAAVAPPPTDFLGHHDGWLRMVFTHEYAHLLHLDRVGGVMKGLRWVLGRNVATFPNLFVPQWQVEGMATWAESAVTGFGRMHASDVAGVVAATTARGDATVDRAGGGLVAWPSGYAPYFMGGTFDEALAAEYAPKALGDLTRETARRLPFFGGGAYEKVFGAGAGDLWRVVFPGPSAPAASPATNIVRLTRDGFAVSGPRVVRRPAPAGVNGDIVVYSALGPHRFPDIRMVGLGGGRPTHLVSRFEGQTVSSDGRWLFFDQLEYDGPSAIVADLYALDLDSGRVRRLSRGERLTDPDVDAAGTRLVATRARDGVKQLTVWRLRRSSDGAPSLADVPDHVIGSAGCQYGSPRWSPDASLIAAERQCPGSLPVIVEVAATGDGERVLASGARNLSPTWSRDGRRVLFVSDRQDARFKLFAIDRSGTSAAGEALTMQFDAPGGVMWPDLSGDGSTIVFASLTAEGYDVFAARIHPQAGGQAEPPRVVSQPAAPAPSASRSRANGDSPDAAQPAPARYSPWSTLLPRAWSPLLNVNGDDVDIGATAGASDVLGYHEYSVAAAWRVSGQDADIVFDGPPLSWSLSYAYNRWRPSFLLSAWRGLETVGMSDDGETITRTAQERSQGLFVGTLVPWRRVRLAQNWMAGVEIDERRLPAEAGIADRSRNAWRAGWALNSSREYGYSISAEDGVRAALNVERVTPGLGADAHAVTFTADARAYVPGFGAHHVVAVRLAAAGSEGDAGMTRSFSLGGSAVPADTFVIAKRAVGLLRGLPVDDRTGAAVLVGNLDYRFPLARVERGIRTWPFFLRDLHGAVFLDVGSAGPALDTLPKAARSMGGEIASRLTLGYSWNLSVAAGAAWVHDPRLSSRPDRFAVFIRTGYAF